MLSVLWVMCASMWFYQHVPNVTLRASPPFTYSALASPTLSGANVGPEQNGLVRRHGRS